MDERGRAIEVLFTLFLVMAIEIIVGVLIEKIIHNTVFKELGITIFALNLIVLRIKFYLDDLNWLFKLNIGRLCPQQIREAKIAIGTGIGTWILWVASGLCLTTDNGFSLACVIFIIAIIVTTIAIHKTPEIDPNNKCSYTICNGIYATCTVLASISSNIISAALMLVFFVTILCDWYKHDSFKVLFNNKQAPDKAVA